MNSILNINYRKLQNQYKMIDKIYLNKITMTNLFIKTAFYFE